MPVNDGDAVGGESLVEVSANTGFRSKTNPYAVALNNKLGHNETDVQGFVPLLSITSYWEKPICENKKVKSGSGIGSKCGFEI